MDTMKNPGWMNLVYKWLAIGYDIGSSLQIPPIQARIVLGVGSWPDARHLFVWLGALTVLDFFGLGQFRPQSFCFKFFLLDLGSR